MSTCSAAEIAEKKRIALEKLQAKKKQLNGNVTSVTTAPSSAPTVQKPSVTSPVQNFYKSNQQNKAADFLRAIKQSSTFANRKVKARNSTHPYQKPPSENPEVGKSVIKNALSPENNKPKVAPVFMQTSCTCYLLSTTRFAVQPSGYHQQLIDVFKTIPSKSYDSVTKIWSFALKDYQLYQDRVAGLKPYVVTGLIPKKVLKLCETPTKDPDPSCLASIEPKLVNSLLPFQKEGVMFGLSKHGRVMICDEMGLGKTYQALAIADFYRDDWPLFICTTASTRDSWATHVTQLLPSVLVHQVSILSSIKQYTGDAKVLITSYSLMEKSAETLLEKKFGVLILDESHTLKNSKAKCTVVADRLAQQARRVILLSGTPALSRPLELFSQLQMIDRRFLNFMDYTSRYCAGKQTNFGWDATGQSNLDELKVILKLKFMIRRIKADVLPQLAEKLRETVVLDPALIFYGSAVQKSFSNYTEEISRTKGKEKEGILLRFYSETAEVKARAVCEYLKTLVKEKLKFIVFAHHKVMIDAICDSLDKQKVKYIKIDGSTKAELRSELVDIFQKKATCKVAVLSMKACNSGITLTAAQTIVFAELDWNPSTLAQAECRAHRIGQESTVTCRYLMATGTADDVIWNMLKTKQDVLNKAGLFSEDLRDATHSAAPVSTRSIQSYMTPVKKMNPTQTDSNKNVVSGNFEKRLNECTDSPAQDKMTSKEPQKEEALVQDSFEDMFDEDDDAFKDLVY